MNQEERLQAGKETLLGYFERHFLPLYLGDAAEGTVTSYRETIRHWQRRTADPPLAEIDNAAVAAFKASFRATGGTPVPLPAPSLPKPLATATINKHLRQLNAMLAKAGPVGPRNRDALEILDRVAWTKPLKQRRRLPRNVSDETIATIYRACRVAEFPAGTDFPAGDFWRALIVTALTTGFRRQGLFALQWDHVDVERAEVHLDAEDDKCNTERCKPLHSQCLRHIESIRNGEARVFAWHHSWKTFYREWHRIQQAAGIPPAEHITLHDLKRACGTRFARVGSPWVVMDMLDHSMLSTSTKSYVNATDEARAVIERLPLPAVFAEERSSERQLRLF